MILTCQNCSTSFRLEDTLLKATGSKVRCSRCRNMWVAFPPESAPEDDAVPGGDERTPQAAVMSAAVLGAGAAAAGLSEDASDALETPSDMPPELKFFADDDVDGDLSEDEDLVTDEINLDELDQLLSEEAEPLTGPRPDEDFKTEELDLADLEKMLDIHTDEQPPEKTTEAAVPDHLDLAEAFADDADAAELEKEDSVIEELDLDLEDIENLLEEDTGLGEEIAAAGENSSGLDETAEDRAVDDLGAEADEIDLDMASNLDALLEEDDQEPVVEETEELGASEMADVLADADQEAPTDADDEDLDFELAPGLDGIFDEGADSDIPIEETEELDFSELSASLASPDEDAKAEADDLELALEAGDAGGAPLGEVGDLDDLELALEEDKPSGDAAETDVPELDLSDLSLDLGEGGAAVENADDVEEEEPELKLEIDGVSADDDAVEALELDFDLDEDDNAEGAPPAETTGVIPEETRELEAEELESLLENVGQPDNAEEASESLELDIDLDRMADDEADAFEDATRELDLNDIEKILEMDKAGEPAPPETGETSEELDLDLDMDSVAPPAEAAGDSAEETTGTDDALDLSELERMLDVEDTTDSPTSADEDLDDLDLDFDLQPATDESDDLDLEFDMLDEEPAEASALFDTSESEDLGLDIDNGETDETDHGVDSDLDFEIIDDDLAVQEVDLDIDAEEIGAETLSDTVSPAVSSRMAAASRNRDLTQELMDEMAAADTQTMKAPPMEAKPIKPAPPPIKRKKQSSKGLVLLLILVLLGGAAYLLPKYTDLKLPLFAMPDLSGIPVIGSFFTPSTPEAVVPVEATLKGNWVQNEQVGRLYTIEGRVRNEYDNPRSFIRVTGRVYASGRQFQREATAYCGNILTAEQLATMPLADIQRALSNRTGSDNQNVKVAAGQEVPFMVVFGDLPPDVELQEFAVEISGSLPVAATD